MVSGVVLLDNTYPGAMCIDGLRSHQELCMCESLAVAIPVFKLYESIIQSLKADFSTRQFLD
jgi:hypothetical protein